VQGPTEKEMSAIVDLLEAGIITTRIAVLVLLFSYDTRSKRTAVIAEELRIRPTTLSMAADTMVRDGHIDRHTPFRDLRQVSLALTHKGEDEAKNCLLLLRSFAGAQ
jgi:DNA-binding MarR family transcriptional regulator